MIHGFGLTAQSLTLYQIRQFSDLVVVEGFGVLSYPVSVVASLGSVRFRYLDSVHSPRYHFHVVPVHARAGRLTDLPAPIYRPLVSHDTHRMVRPFHQTPCQFSGLGSFQLRIDGEVTTLRTAPHVPCATSSNHVNQNSSFFLYLGACYQ